MTAPIRFQPYSRTTRRVVTVALLAFVVLLGVGLTEAHCDPLKPAALYLSLSAADLGSTRYAVNHGATEANSFMRSNAVPKQLALAGLLTIADVHLQRSGHQKRLRIAVTVIRLAAVAINVNNGRRAK